MTFAISRKADLPENIKRRIRMEAAIGKCLVKSLLEAGFALADGQADDDAPEAKPTTSFAAVMRWMGECDEDRVLVYRTKTDERPIGWVYLIYGNSGWDVVNDYTTNIADQMKQANELANRLDPDNRYYLR